MKVNISNIPIGITSSICVMFWAILSAAFDVLGEYARIHCGLPVILLGSSERGNVGDASKLSLIVGVQILVSDVFQFIDVVDVSELFKIVGVVNTSELSQFGVTTAMRMRSRMNATTAGTRIWNVVTTMRRFCSSQFFHSSSPNCAAFDIAMVMSVPLQLNLKQTQVQSQFISLLHRYCRSIIIIGL